MRGILSSSFYDHYMSTKKEIAVARARAEGCVPLKVVKQAFVMSADVDLTTFSSQVQARLSQRSFLTAIRDSTISCVRDKS